MSKRPILAALSVGCSLLVASSCWAATVIEPVQGNLYINRGQGYQPVTGPIEANVGDSIMVSPGGTGAVVYADGCRVSVLPGTVTTIRPSSPCSNPYGPAQPPPSAALDNTYLLAATALLAAAGLGVAIYAATKNDNDNNNNGISCGGSHYTACWVTISP